MSTDTQVAISRPPRISSAQHVPKAARQTVPAFLQKLFEMVNDAKNQDLIRWSEAGDSFFVLDHERFAREVLGRWFKHQNFSSFVRQLNMYGFHKIPHLQQGVLRSETDTEYWNFAHSNFRRDQPDLLCLIQRKKQAAQQADEAAVDVRDPNSSPVPSAGLTQGQIDLQSILQGIAAIKRHQTTISAELNDLKQSNQMLWQESMEARGRLQKQQDTINRILKFLAGVFGNHAANGHHHKDDVVGAARPENAVIPRRRTRLMIEGANHEPSGKVGIIEVEDPEAATATEPMNTLYNNTSYALETPATVPSPSPSLPHSDVAGSTTTETNHYAPTNPSAIVREDVTSPDVCVSDSAPSTIVPSDTTFTQTQSQPPPQHTSVNLTTTSSAVPQPSVLDRAVTPSRTPTYELDPRIQQIFNTFNQDQLTQLLTTLSQTVTDTDHTPSDIPSPAAVQLTFPHAPSTFDFSSVPPPGPNSPLPLLPHASLPNNAVGGGGGGSEGLISFDSNMSVDSPLTTRLERNWRATEDIEKEVNLMDPHIDRLAEILGPYLNDGSFVGTKLGDPTMSPPATTTTTSSTSTPSAGPPPSQSVDLNGLPQMDASPLDPSSLNHDFDIDAFLSTLPHHTSTSGGGGLGDSTMGGYHDLGGPDTAFLDEVPSPAGTNSHSNGSEVTNSPVVNVRVIEPSQTTTATVAPSSTTNGGGGSVTPTNTNGTTMSTTTTSVVGRKRKSDVISDLEGAFGAASVGDGRVGSGKRGAGAGGGGAGGAAVGVKSSPVKSKRKKD